MKILTDKAEIKVIEVCLKLVFSSFGEDQISSS